MRFATDTGGTFTDLVVESDTGELRMYKAPTTMSDPVLGVIDALRLAAEDHEESLAGFVGRADMMIHGTTHAINAIITNRTAKTALLTTEGHRDILVLREGGRTEPFDFTIPYPEPYIPRALTFEVSERMSASGTAHTPLSEPSVLQIIGELRERRVEAVAVCLLWSILNPSHEQRIGELLREHLPGVPFTLSHELNPIMREYRRASSAAIDASLKPLIASYLDGLTSRLADAGFTGRTLVLTSQGGMLDAEELARSPIHAINSGPSMAPVAGRYYAGAVSDLPYTIVADTGGTTFDVSLVRRGRIPLTNETWIGRPFRGHMTGFPSIDIRSVGAGGGSVAWVSEGGLLHVGPKSAGAVPGPACYGAGGTAPTVTDAALVLGLLDADFFLGGTMKLDVGAAGDAIERDVATPLGRTLNDAAAAVIDVATENMVQAIADITINQGIDPAEAVLVGGGGAAGLNAVSIARRLGCPTVVIPEVGAALSAAGALMTHLSMEYRATHFVTSDAFAFEGVERVLRSLEARCEAFSAGPGAGAASTSIEYVVEARYAHQVWEIDLPLRHRSIRSDDDLETLVEDFHKLHEEIFAIRDPGSIIEMVGWKATVRCQLREGGPGRLRTFDAFAGDDETRVAVFPGVGPLAASLYRFDTMPAGVLHHGPAIIESAFTTVVADPGSSFERTADGSLVLHPRGTDRSEA